MRSLRRALGVSAVLTLLLLPALTKAVTVGPAKLQISIDPGQSTSGTVYLKNDGGKPQTFYPSVERFSQNTEGQKVFTPDQSGLASWFKFPTSVTLNAGQDEQVPFTFTAPKDAAPAGHFGVIWWSTSPPGEGGNVAVVTRAGVLVYVSVSGNIIEKAHLNSLTTDPAFAWGLPLDFNIELKNDGNVAVTGQGDIKVTNIFGATKAVLPVNPYGAITLPGSNESFRSTWQGQGFFFGVYKASLTLHYGANPQTLTAQTWFVLVSPLAAIILVLAILLFFITPPLIRKYNRWIIARARQR